ncbi:MAG: ATP-dependent Clp protease ATP-binding subunit [Candidatus Niyogibacteria bacterium]|nr:ATP-dependent Clp protease ATP-binding subunit [Candidatus Niyogibacteria bacterium]
MTMADKAQVFDFSPGRAEKNIISHLNRFVVGQERAKKRIVDIVLRRETGFRDPRRPLGVIFLLGPTGVGKTELIKATADFLFGNLGAYTHISCPNFQNGHEISQLIGSPAGYVGYNQEPFLSQNNIDKHDFYRRMEMIEDFEKRLKYHSESIKSINSANLKQEKESILKEIESLIERIWVLKNQLKNKRFFSLVLFDEFEKAHPKLQEMLLEILSDGALSLMSGKRVDFTNTIIALTGNIASKEIKEEMSGSKIGLRFHSELTENSSKRIYKIVLARLEKTVSPEILGRIGKEGVEVCNFLNQEEMAEVLELQIKGLEERVKNNAKAFKLYICEGVKQFLLSEIQDRTNIFLGARALLNVFKKRIENPLNKLLAKDEDEGGIAKGDIVKIRLKKSKDKEELEFTRQI